MNRRSFLSLLISTPALVSLPGVTLEHALPVPAAPPVPPVPRRFTAEALRAAARALPNYVRYALPLMLDEGFEPLIQPGRVARFVAMPQKPFRPDRLLVSAGRSFELLGVSSAGEPQLDDVVPGWLFAPEAYGTRLEFGATAPGESIVLCARNVSQAPSHFAATLIGTSIDDSPARPVSDFTQLELDEARRRRFEALEGRDPDELDPLDPEGEFSDVLRYEDDEE